MNPRATVTLATLLLGIATNLIVEVIIRQQKEIQQLQSQVEQQRLTLQELVIKETSQETAETEE
jgi:predicted Holliday junction resolvase-like endonuclease